MNRHMVGKMIACACALALVVPAAAFAQEEQAPGSQAALDAGATTYTEFEQNMLELAAEGQAAAGMQLLDEDDITLLDWGTYTCSMNLTQMAAAQRAHNPYIANVTDADLRAALDPSKVSNYQFMDLRSYTGMTAEQINTYLSSTANGRRGTLAGHGLAFVNAAKAVGMNEAFLTALAVLESGWGTSSLASGFFYDGTYPISATGLTRDEAAKVGKGALYDEAGKIYPAGTYYNFFGIGATDSNAWRGGTMRAIEEGWNSVDAAVLGGAKWKCQNYIYRSRANGAADNYNQPTIYLMKWDYERGNDNFKSGGDAYGWHQYSTPPSWASSNANLVQAIYLQTGASPSLNYIAPRYAAEATTPSTGGNGGTSGGSTGGNGGSTGGSTGGTTTAPIAFSDVNTSDWAYSAIQYVASRGIMTGISTTTFGQTETLTRAQAAQVLFNYCATAAEKANTAKTNKTKLSDVKDNQWYTQAVNWIVSKQIMSGSAGAFRPQANITREELCVVLARAGKTFGGERMDWVEYNKARAMPDWRDVSSWAQVGVAWALDEDIMSGRSIGGKRYISPQGVVARNEMAQMMKNAIEDGAFTK